MTFLKVTNDASKVGYYSGVVVCVSVMISAGKYTDPWL
jgi:hypothetical protein